jgi:hypothetical protein
MSKKAKELLHQNKIIIRKGERQTQALAAKNIAELQRKKKKPD